MPGLQIPQHLSEPQVEKCWPNPAPRAGVQRPGRASLCAGASEKLVVLVAGESILAGELSTGTGMGG